MASSVAFVEAAMIRHLIPTSGTPFAAPAPPPPGPLDIRLRSDRIRREVSADRGSM